MYNDEKMIISATRIKECRNSMGLSHKKLADALTEKYEIKISVDALKVYEVKDEFHSRFRHIKGMKIEYLYCLADFFKVSTDYLLGLSDVKTPNVDVNEINRITGLSEKAIETLIQNIDDEYYKSEGLLDTVNTLIEQEWFPIDIFNNDIQYRALVKSKPIMVLSKIRDYLLLNSDDNRRFGIENGKLTLLEKNDKSIIDLKYDDKITEKEIIENTFLLEIQSRLKELKSKQKHVSNEND